MKGHQFKSWIFELREILREIKGVVLFVVVVLIYRINNRKMVERKNLYLFDRASSYTYEFHWTQK